MPTLTTIRKIVTHWTLNGVRVSTVHPQYGEIFRGRITLDKYGAPARTSDHCMWRLVDLEGSDLGWFCGDYVTAQNRLLDATAYLDEIDESTSTTEA